MPYILEDLIVDRIDLVDEGANSAAFIEVFKRKEQGNPMELSEILSKMKPEHAAVIQGALDAKDADVSKLRGDVEKANSTISEQASQITTLTEELAKAKPKECEGKDCKTCDKAKECDKACGGKKEAKAASGTSFDEAEVLKSMPEAIRQEYIKMRQQKEAAEEQVRKAAEEKAHNEAVAKAATLKALPVEQDVLVDILKSCDSRVVDVLTTAAAAIDGTVLDETGKSVKKPASSASGADAAWSKIETEADKLVASEQVTKQKAIAMVIKQKPDLYREYLNGGAN